MGGGGDCLYVIFITGASVSLYSEESTMASIRNPKPSSKGKAEHRSKAKKVSQINQKSPSEIFSELIGKADDLPRELSTKKFRVLTER